MKKHLNRWIALVLALLLALPLVAVAEEASVEEELTISDLIPESDMEELPEDLSDLSLLDTIDPSLLDSGNLAQEDPVDISESEAIQEAPETSEEEAGESIEAPTSAEEPQSEAASNAEGIPKKLSLGVKEKYKIDASSLGKKPTYKSSNTKVASVTKKGVIKGVKAGKAKITVTTSNKKKATITVTVAKAPTQVTMSNPELTLTAGDTFQLSAILPKKTASYKRTWSSSNPDVAAVSEKGLVYALSEGTAVIYVRTFNNKTATCTVTVIAPTPEPTPEPTPTPAPVKKETVSEIIILFYKDIATANSMLEDELVYYKENFYSNDYFGATVNGNGLIDAIILTGGSGKYTLSGIYPGESLSNAVSMLDRVGWKFLGEKSQVGYFTADDLPGFVLNLKYSNGRVEYIAIISN